MKKITELLILLTILIFAAAACTSTPAISQQQYDQVNSDLNTAKSQVTDLQVKLAQAQTKIDGLNQQYNTARSNADALQAKYDELNKQSNAAKSDYSALQAKYDDLSKQYNSLVEKTTQNTTIIAADVEQAIFKLVNQDRVSHGVPELQWGVNIYGWATQNSQSMAKDKKVEVSSYLAYQETFWATGYDTTDKIASAAVTVWKNTARYDINFLNNATKYGAAAAYKSGDIYYISWVADFYR